MKLRDRRLLPATVPVLEDHGHEHRLQLVKPSDIKAAAIKYLEHRVDEAFIFDLMKNYRQSVPDASGQQGVRARSA